jgi:hypothetical protein
MKIVIEWIQQETEGEFSGWKVTHGDKYADGLGYEEMLGVVAAITMPENRPPLNWLKTKDEHLEWRNRFLKKLADESNT